MSSPLAKLIIWIKLTRAPGLLGSSAGRRSRGPSRTWECIGVLFVTLSLVACGRTDNSSPAILDDAAGATPNSAGTVIRMQEVTAASGARFSYRNGAEARHYTIPETIGGGVALFDFDRDGRPDMFVPGGGSISTDLQLSGRRSALFRNNGKLKFVGVTEHAGCGPSKYYSHGASAGDYDGDGFPDILVTGYGGLQLWRNLGDGTFTEAAEQAGLKDYSWSTGAAWGDLDGDGDLDLFVVHYVDWSADNNPACPAALVDEPEVCSPKAFKGLPDRLFRNRGDGTFAEWSQPNLEDDGKGLGVVIADIDLDRDLDVYVANDTTRNSLYTNDGAGMLSEIGVVSGTAYSDDGMADGSMGVAVGDFNQDGLPDLWVANFENESFALYRNNGGGLFTHVSDITGVTDVGGLYVGWGTSFCDFDCDGDEDIVSINGHVLRHPVGAPVRQQPLLFENRTGRFVNVADDAGRFTTGCYEGRGMAAGDLDADGDMDFVLSRLNESAGVVENVSQVDHHWIEIRLVGRTTHRDATGAIVRLTHDQQTQVKQLVSGASYLSTNESMIHFGLGTSSSVDSVRIEWPSGFDQQYELLQADRCYTILEPGHPADPRTNLLGGPKDQDSQLND